jgi:hypothetical protein
MLVTATFHCPQSSSASRFTTGDRIGTGDAQPEGDLGGVECLIKKPSELGIGQGRGAG